ncbi:MAG TPA: PadR family transcriptional regulator [Gaiellales bacterium]|nr:PadR family transcriptional regulator [Gaiellales bacterium]
MSSDSLTPFSYVILVLVGDDGAGAHDIRRMAERGAKLYWAAAPSQYYAEPKRLAKLGYLEAAKEPGRTNERTRYRLTQNGREALREWLRTPAPFPRIQNEAAVRLLVADLVPPDVLRSSLEALEREIDIQEQRLAEAQDVAGGLGHRERWLMINHRVSLRLLDAQRAWIAEVRDALDGPGT